MKETFRNYRMDNFKAVLIFLVVFGHLLECFGGRTRLGLYFVIYTFHMPAFAFATGRFSKQSAGRLIKKIAYPYFIYQILYLMFQRFYLREENLIQFTVPYWLLWYLMSSFCWTLLLEIIDGEDWDKKRVVVVSVLLALVVGFDKSVGMSLSLSRTIVLLPFFVIGHYRSLEKIAERYHFLLQGISMVLVVLSVYMIWMKVDVIKGVWLYHSISYAAGEYSVWIRGGVLLVALAWIVCLLSIMPNKEIKIVTSLGRYTFPVFLLHGFIVRWAAKINLFHGTESHNIFMAFVTACVICLCIGNKWIVKLLHFTFSMDRIKA